LILRALTAIFTVDTAFMVNFNILLKFDSYVKLILKLA
jgi:hypothetical protein